MDKRTNEILHLDKYIEAFVDFYGEENRALIVEKLSAVELLRVDSLIESKPQDLSSFFSIKTNNKTDELKASVKNELLKLNIKGNIDDYLDEIIISDNPYISPYCTENNGSFEPKCLFVLPQGCGLDDHAIIHELNHVLASSFKDITEKGFEFLTGIDKVHIDFNQNNRDEEDLIRDNKRNMELFNEVLNDFATKVIVDSLKANNGEIFGTSCSHNSYSLAFGPMKNFLVKNIHKIARLELNGEQNELVKMLGKERFLDMNEYINNYLSYSSFDIYNIVSSISTKLGKTEPLKLNEILTSRDDIELLDLSVEERKYVRDLYGLNDLSQNINLSLNNDIDN